jgi:hypothetical protein
MKPKKYQKTLKKVIKNAYKSFSLALKVTMGLFVFLSVWDFMHIDGKYFVCIFGSLIAFPLTVCALVFDFLVVYFICLKNEKITHFLRRSDSVKNFIFSTIKVCSSLVVLLMATAVIFKKLFVCSILIVSIIVLAIIFDAIFFKCRIFHALNESFGKCVLYFSVFFVFIYLILNLIGLFFDDPIPNHRIVDKLFDSLNKFVLLISIFYVINLWFFNFVELVCNFPILNCRNFPNFDREKFDKCFIDTFIKSTRIYGALFLCVIIVSLLISDFLFTSAFVVAIIIIWAIDSDALMHNITFIKAFVAGIDFYILEFLIFSILNYSLLIFIALILDNPIPDKRFLTLFNPSFILSEYSLKVFSILICCILKLVNHSIDNLILKRRFVFSLSKFIIISCFFSVIVLCIPNFYLPVFDNTILNQRILTILMASIDKFILLICIIYIFIYLIIILIALIFEQYSPLDEIFFYALFKSFCRFTLLFLLCSLFTYLCSDFPFLDRNTLGVLNAAIFIFIILGLKFHYKKFFFNYLFKPASFFGVLIICYHIFGSHNFIAMMSNYSFLVIYIFFIFAIYS